MPRRKCKLENRQNKLSIQNRTIFRTEKKITKDEKAKSETVASSGGAASGPIPGEKKRRKSVEVKLKTTESQKAIKRNLKWGEDKFVFRGKPLHFVRQMVVG